MFNKLKQFKDLRNQAKQMQTLLEAESITVDKHGIKITINGNMEIKDLKISTEISDKEKLEKNLQDAFNHSVKEAQSLMAKKLRESGTMPNLGF
jgi:DNA-binding protein YbaB